MIWIQTLWKNIWSYLNKDWLLMFLCVSSTVFGSGADKRTGAAGPAGGVWVWKVIPHQKHLCVRWCSKRTSDPRPGERCVLGNWMNVVLCHTTIFLKPVSLISLNLHRCWDLHCHSGSIDWLSRGGKDQPAALHVLGSGWSRPHARHGLWATDSQDCRPDQGKVNTLQCLFLKDLF